MNNNNFETSSTSICSGMKFSLKNIFKDEAMDAIHRLRDYMEFFNLDLPWLAADLGIYKQALADILEERQPITEEIAKRLANTFHTKPELWTNLQNKYNEGS